MTTRETSSAERPASEPSSWEVQCPTWAPDSRTSSPSPRQRIGVSRLASAADTLRLTRASSSPWIVRRSECPTMTHVQPSFASIDPETAPGSAARLLRGEVLAAVADRHRVRVDHRLHAAQVGERGADADVDVVVVLARQREVELLDDPDGLEVVQVHL